ncbi:hypothetical protein C2S51_014773 [Perilla frutescens var. frutescens]|nr:hypothetical protein C2S51_014773 [Perilla frutescens var. frutescens]
MAYAALVSLANTIDLNLNHNLFSIPLEQRQRIISLYEYVNPFQAFLEKFPDKFTSLEERMREVAHEAEDVIEYIVLEMVFSSSDDKSGCHTSGKHELQLEKVMENIDLIAGEVKKIEDSSSSEDVQQHGADSSFLSSSSSGAPTICKDDAIVGIEDHVIDVKDRLCGESSKLEVIPICGMGGIGKTTLAKNVYNDPLIMENFVIRVWVTISQDYSAQRILSSLLESLKEFLKEFRKNELDKLADQEKVYKILMGRKYLVVMDDMWSSDAWDFVRKMFPDDGNGSRILLTTRLSDVASYPDSSSKLHEMHLMDADRSWDLLKHKVFPDEDCPFELEKIGKEIARSCKGLPLAILVIAGLLSTVSKNRASWQEIAENVKCVETAEKEHIEEILSLSYTHLPQYLRPCFLYMGSFPEDEEISVVKLIRLWIAEGFVKPPIDSDSFEKVGEECLEKLVKRNLVLVKKRKFDGRRIKSCGLHDLMRDLCIRKAHESKLFLNLMEKHIEKEIFVESMLNQRRVNVDSSNLMHLSSLNGSTIHSIKCSRYHWVKLDFLESVKLLRVLDAESANVKDSPSMAQLYQLFHLRYLNIRYCHGMSGSLLNLQNLQTLIIHDEKRFIGGRLRLQWFMPQLRHVYFYGTIYLCDPKATDCSLESLQTLSYVEHKSCTERILKKIPNLKKLKIDCSGGVRRGDAACLNDLVHLHQLETLEVYAGCWVESRPKSYMFTFPRMLKRLSLRDLELPWNDLAIVGSLPNLQVLKIKDFSCYGSTWETTEGAFPVLEVLLMEYLDLENWISESSHFPSLKRLLLHYCRYLKGIPNDIGEIPTLELIEVKGNVRKSLVESAEEIQKEQEELGNNTLQVLCINAKTIDVIFDDDSDDDDIDHHWQLHVDDDEGHIDDGHKCAFSSAEFMFLATFSHEAGVLLVVERTPAITTTASGSPMQLLAISFPMISNSGGAISCFFIGYNGVIGFAKAKAPAVPIALQKSEMAYAALISLANTVDMIKNHNQYFSIPLKAKQQIISLSEYVTLFQIFLEKFPDKFNNLEGRMRELVYEAEDIIEYEYVTPFQTFLEKFRDKFNNLEGRMRELVYEAEDIIEYYMLEQVSSHNPSEKHELPLEKVIDEIVLIAGEVKEEIEDSSSSKGVQQCGVDSSPLSSSSSDAPPIHKDDAMVNFEGYVMELKDRLCGEPSRLQVIPICGMGGIGKTTLAKNVHDDPLIVEKFDIRVWVTISQDYSAERILSSLLESLKEFNIGRLGQTNEEKVHKILMGRRYLVVIDDIWTSEAWDVVRMVFPDNGNGSRIMITTRLSDVASYPDPSSRLCTMSLMDEDQSWSLLKKKVFKDEECPFELEKIGKEIARSCKGLPLAIVVTSGTLSTLSKSLSSWQEIAENVKSAETAEKEEIEKILSLSYTHLPQYLRPCFLYMGSFPEDEEIRVTRLIRLWIAEGFVKPPIDSDSFEKVGEECLEELVKRNLVLVKERKCDGRSIKSCNLHDLMRDLCIRKAHESKLFLNLMEKHIEKESFVESMQNQRRVNVDSSNLMHLSSLNGSTIHSIKCSQGHLVKLDFLESVKLLRVLDAEPANVEYSPSMARLYELFHLRYLNIGYCQGMSGSLLNLQNLQTLIIHDAKRFVGGRFRLQWLMPQLRHVYFYGTIYFCHPKESYCSLESLQTLSYVEHKSCTERILKKIPNLKKFKIDCSGGVRHGDAACLNDLVHLHRLETLEVYAGCWVESRPKSYMFTFPRMLKRLSLRTLNLAWNDLAIVGSLPNLQVLKLKDDACIGSTWETMEGVFLRLEVLVMEALRLEEWIAESSHFPCLKRLLLHSCWNLKGIPNDIGEILTLELIKVKGDTKMSLVESAEEIQKEQEDLGNSTLQVLCKFF